MADPAGTRRPLTVESGEAEQLPVLVPLRQDALSHPLDGGDFFTEPAVIPINYDGGTF
jgi:hypothetical protein